ncbi:5-formyltetrahydrofolate cyclo-ligase [Defluviimonas salinarum]|uniref:5-formyltetrahydrofolate cyclo-ligase n=1 Tax=Defluviimonas salinarum TaxID=2992147 RepID=A0ABT3J9M0_9RHOB|nr:5-formyltetrahydrofolate cyclo-ligase [Defluviimonas salinarum]MCW3784397.1 5-formyltetrahydrofolate cyclo-ligase [Defluviimonas salinarum]
MNADKSAPGRYASPPCMAAEVDPAYFDRMAVDPDQACDTARWRRFERERLRAERLALSADLRSELAARVAGHLDGFLAAHVGMVAGRIVSGYWPIKGELDLRPWLTALHEKGAVIALPVVEERAEPLVFRRWQPGMTMERGHWNIPVPPATAERVAPAIALSPLVGWDGAGFRLGYGGGYFDRTLAASFPRPLVIGVGLQAARLATIYPQPHDIPMSAILTEDGPQVDRGSDQ